jgi:secreted trypsin-like serine protease
MAVLALLASTGCAAEAEPEAAPQLGRVQQAVVDGEEDTADPAVVALLGDDGKTYCSGVLIANNVVATAAHCVEPTPPASVYFGTKASTSTGTTIKVVEAHSHPDFDRDALKNDIALVLLARRAPTTPLRVSEDSLDDSSVGEPIRLVGFGLPDPETQSLRKRSGTTEIQEVGDSDFRFVPAPSLTCLGDSGGPALAKVGGHETVIGLASSGDADCKKFGRHTRIDVYADFISEYVDANADSDATPRILSAGCSLGAAPAGLSSSRTLPPTMVIFFSALIGVRRRRRASVAR